jgi:hypothetical protein
MPGFKGFGEKKKKKKKKKPRFGIYFIDLMVLL